MSNGQSRKSVPIERFSASSACAVGAAKRPPQSLWESAVICLRYSAEAPCGANVPHGGYGMHEWFRHAGRHGGLPLRDPRLRGLLVSLGVLGGAFLVADGAD